MKTLLLSLITASILFGATSNDDRKRLTTLETTIELQSDINDRQTRINNENNESHTKIQNTINTLQDRINLLESRVRKLESKVK